MEDTSDITSGEIATAEKALSSGTASPAASTSESTDRAPASARETPAGTETKTDQYGPMPWERHEAILNSTRRPLEEKLRGLSWAEQLKREEVEEALELRRLANTRPADLVKHLSARTTSAPAPDARDEKGEAFYSPQQAAALARHEVQQAINTLRAEFGERLTPIETDRVQSQHVATLTNQIAQASTWPGFGDHIDAITEAVAAANSRHEKLSLHEAYIQVVAPKLAASRDTLLAEGKKAWLAELDSTSQRAKGEINPQRIPAGTRKPDRDKSFSELAEEEIARRRRA